MEESELCHQWVAHNELNTAERTAVQLSAYVYVQGFSVALLTKCCLFVHPLSALLFHSRIMCSLSFVKVQHTVRHISALSLSISQHSLLLLSPLQ